MTTPYWRLPLASETADPRQFPVRVWFSPTAHRQLLSAPLAADVECAGALYGREHPGIFEVERVELADEFRQQNCVSIDSSKVDFLTARAARSGLDLLGDWHTHPHRRGLANPSPADLRSWASWLRASARSRFVGAIVTHDQLLGMERPDVTAFVLESGDNGAARLAATVPAELASTYELEAVEPPRQLRALESCDFADERLSFAEGDTVWSDDVRARACPDAFIDARRNVGGWARKSRPLRVGEVVWWERPTATGLETYYGDLPPEEAAA